MRRPGPRVALAALPLGAVVLAAVASCGTATSRMPAAQVPGSDPARGAQLLTSYGCASCHTIAGVRGADGLVGPPLTGIGRRSYIAGELATTPSNMERWIEDPQGVEPGTAMPNLGVTADDARDITGFLFTTGGR